MYKIFKRNKKRLSVILYNARINDMTLNEYRIILHRLQESKALRKKYKKFGVVLDWANAEFDPGLGWLMVQEYVKSTKREEGHIAVFTGINDLPADVKPLFESQFLGSQNDK